MLLARAKPKYIKLIDISIGLCRLVSGKKCHYRNVKVGFWSYRNCVLITVDFYTVKCHLVCIVVTSLKDHNYVEKI